MTGDLPVSKRIIVDLCGGTGSWSKPYKEAGYDVRLITLPEYDVRTYEPPENVYGILAAPPCEAFSNNLSFNGKKDFNRTMTKEQGLEIVSACLRIIDKCKPQWWALENPRGGLKKHLKHFYQFTFQPYEYGDPWTKKTDVFGYFHVPKKTHTWETCEKLELYTRPLRNKPSFAFLHKGAIKAIPQLAGFKADTDAAFRAITPPGFAQAFFEANR
ncbi:hypothetical protein FACS1894110_18430 [Spirochaetia bacterium]|nr:hypothetical protein FACS1894110_18430 [Spirochaetia bacterium]